MEVIPTSYERQMIRNGQSRDALDSMLARFNNTVQDSGLFRELKARESYEKPSDKRRRKKREAVARARRQERKDAVHTGRAKKGNSPQNRRTSGRSEGTGGSGGA